MRRISLARRAHALLCVASLTLAVGCGSRTISGGLDLPDGATPDDPSTFDAPVFPDQPVAVDAVSPDVTAPDVLRPDVFRPDAPAPTDIPVFPDAPAPTDIPVFPDAPFPPDLPDLPDAISPPDVPLPPDRPEPVDLPVVPDAPVVPNDTCDRAVEVRDGTTLRGEDPARSRTVATPCPGMGGASVPGALFYTVDVPAGQTLTASVMASVTGRGFYYVRVLPACGDTSCLAATPTPGTNASTSWTNVAAAARRVVIVVAPGSTVTVPFDLTVRVRPPPTNTTCAGAARLTSGALVGETLAFAREVSPACLAFGASSGPVLYYTARVGEGERLTVVARRTSSTFYQPLVRVIDGCASAMCLASSAATPMGGDTSRVTWVNPGAARDVVVMVSSNTATSDGTFDLTTALGATPYRMSTVPPACDPMTGATVVDAAVGDDVGTPSLPLPFAFRYFGTAVTTWSVSTNGYLQVWPAPGMSTGALGPVELPASSAPPSMIAPFWDDLFVTPGTGTVRWQVVATPARHLTIEWNNVTFCCGGASPDRLTFQAKLFEAPNAIEFHYCSLSGAARASGANASIGIQDATATQGLSWGIRRAGAADVTAAVRFAPTM